MEKYIEQSCTVVDELSTMAKTFDVTQEVMLAGWPYDRITIQNVWDIRSTYDSLGLHRMMQPSPVGRTACRINEHRWFVAGDIVARIERNNRER